MRFSCTAALALSGGALALSRNECFLQKSADLAKLSDCADHGTLNYCFSHLPDLKTSDIETCYINAGCSSDEAVMEAKYAESRCADLTKAGELRKRHRFELHRVQQTTSSSAVPTPAIFARTATSLQCMTTQTVSSLACQVTLKSGNIPSTLSCYPTMVASSACAPGLMCSMDSQGETICMDMHDDLSVGGIIVTVVFGLAIVTGLTFLTFQCCQERTTQKRLAAKAEATALARAATKKKRAQESRAPLMRQQEGGDPFHDRNQS